MSKSAKAIKRSSTKGTLADVLPEDKRVGGLDRAKIAREEMKLIFSDTKNPMYFAKDLEFAKKFDVTRHTIYKARETLKIPPRSRRIFDVLKKMDTKNLTIKEISSKLNIKYQNLYKILTDNKIVVKSE
jgi:hypothetical protein